MCSQFAPVAPPLMLLDLKDKGALGDYHLLLAHDVVVQEDLYREVFADINPKPFVIMDNSVIELGEPVSTEVMEEAASIVRPDLIVLPDVLGDSERTIELSTKASVSWAYKDLGPFLVVPQGTTTDEFLSCAEDLMHLPRVEGWGVPRHATAKLGSRHTLVYRLMVLRPLYTMHLLGFSDNIQDDISVARAHGVNGIDSAVPIRLGLQNRPFNIHIDSHPPRGNYWETAKVAIPQVLENLAKVRGWITP